MNPDLMFARFEFNAFWSFRFRIYLLVLLTIIVLPNSSSAQSRDRTNPTQLTSNTISGVIGDNVGDKYYYTFEAGPGELVITFDVESNKGAFNISTVTFQVFNEDAKSIGIAYLVVPGGDAGRKVERISFSRRQNVVLKIEIAENSGSGKYKLQLSGDVALGQSGSNISKEKLSGSGCLPKQGTLIIKMKDGSKKIIDLSEADTITVVP